MHLVKAISIFDVFLNLFYGIGKKWTLGDFTLQQNALTNQRENSSPNSLQTV